MNVKACSFTLLHVFHQKSVLDSFNRDRDLSLTNKVSFVPKQSQTWTNNAILPEVSHQETLTPAALEDNYTKKHSTK